MLGHVCSLNALEVTDSASVPLFTCVRHFMVPQLPLLPEPHLTLFAAEWLFACVEPHVVFKGRFLPTAVVALVALERFFLYVELQELINASRKIMKQVSGMNF